MQKIFKQLSSDLANADHKAIFALIYTAFGLTCIYYLKEKTDFLVPYAHSNNLPFLAYWVAVVMVFYTVLPALAIKLYYREDLKKYGLAFSSEEGFLKILGICLAIMLPIVYLMSTTAGFSSKYPFFRVYDQSPYLSTAFLFWELIYFLQFFGLEFFFRGFLVHSLKPSLGIYSIFVMTVPYCMIHFGKPMPETLAAVLAGIFLGWMSYRSRSIWLGFVLHCSVAIAMDLLALLNKGLLY